MKLTENKIKYIRRRQKAAEELGAKIAKDHRRLVDRGLDNGLIVDVLTVKYGVSRPTVYKSIDLDYARKRRKEIRAMLGSNPLKGAVKGS
ncbi:hypothetical protein LJC53_02945 [Bacteroidales bacterium OttesenSCG-928-C03]|nr:hypothetical protein [Bacteroidales bacterium OttesenSCG-928-C03]MDL2326149.1 hypothetical protein [Bacteroidales bacterium OttesenSCG-928-A14]